MLTLSSLARDRSLRGFSSKEMVWYCGSDAKRYTSKVDKLRFFKFLAGLNQEYDLEVTITVF